MKNFNINNLPNFSESELNDLEKHILTLPLKDSVKLVFDIIQSDHYQTVKELQTSDNIKVVNFMNRSCFNNLRDVINFNALYDYEDISELEWKKLDLVWINLSPLYKKKVRFNKLNNIMP